MAQDDLLQFANNPYLNLNQLSLADALAQQNAPTLPEIKTQEVYGKLQEKKQKLGLTPPIPQHVNIWAGDSLGNSGLLDVAQSGITQAGGVLMDAGKAVSNKLLGTDFDDRMETGWSDRDTADALTGVSQEVRQKGLQQQGKVGDAVAEGRYWDAIAAVPDAAAYTAADSAGSLAEIAAGTLLTGGIGTVATVANMGHKLWKGKKALEKVSDGVDAAKAATVLSKQANITSTADKWLDHVKTAAKATPKAMAQTSLVTTDIVQRQRDEFKKLHNREPNAVELSGMVVTNALIMSVSPWMIKELYLPHPLRNIGKASKETIERAAKQGKTVSDKSLRDKFQNELSKVAERLDKGAIAAISDGVYESGKKVLAAGGAEAVQEYFQTWAGILGTNINTEKGDSVLNQALAQLKSKDKRDEAITGALLGAGAGGVTKGVIEVPGVALGATGEVAKGVTKVTGKYLADKAKGTGDKLISDEQQQQIDDDYRVNKELHDKVVAKNENKTVEVEKAKNVDDITNPEIRTELVAAAGKNANLRDPEVFDAAADKLISKYKGIASASKVGLEASRGFKYAKAGATTVAETVTETINITKEDIDAAIQTTKALGTAAINELKTLNRSATRGVVGLAIDATNNQTRKGFKTLRTGLRQYTPTAMETVASVIAADAPKVATELRRTAQNKRDEEQRRGLHEESLINEGNLSDAINVAANKSTFNPKEITLPAAIIDAAKGRWEDLNTVEIVERALQNHMSSDMYKTGKGLPETEAKRIQGKINKVRNVLKKQPVEKAKQVGSKLTRKAEKYAVKAGNLAKKNFPAAIKKIDQWTSDFINGKPGKTEKKTVKDAQTKRSWVIKTNEQMEMFLANFRGIMTQARERGPEDVKTAYDKIVATISTPNVLKLFSDSFDTTDPEVIIAVLKDGIPALLLDDSALENIRNTLKETLKGAEKKTGAKEVQRELNAETGEDLENPGISYVDEKLSPEQMDIAEQVIAMLGKGVCK